jgi:hypothetical protein
MSKKTYGIVALVASIVGLVGSFIPVVSYVAPAGPIVGLIFAILGRRLPDDGDPSTNGMLKAGLIMSIISLALSVTCLICAVCAICGLGAIAESFSY